MTTDSYYHFLRVKVTDKDTYLEAVELPSPANTITDRYLSAGQLFAKALYKEYKSFVIIITIIILCIICWIIWNTREKWKRHLLFWGKFLPRLFREAAKLYAEIKKDILQK